MEIRGEEVRDVKQHRARFKKQNADSDNQLSVGGRWRGDTTPPRLCLTPASEKLRRRRLTQNHKNQDVRSENYVFRLQTPEENENGFR